MIGNTEVRIGGEELLIMKESNILGSSIDLATILFCLFRS
jgi:hypothetical protein